MPHHYDLLTVDVWDTLLRRRTHPDCVKLHVCRCLLLLSAGELNSDCQSQWRLLRLRQQAEKEVGNLSRNNGFDDEYELIPVYRTWLGLAGYLNAEKPQDSISILLHKLEKIEIQQEEYVSYPDPNILQLIGEFSAGRVMFLSDFYMSGQVLQDLLEKTGMPEHVRTGLVSCDVGMNKRSGRIFEYVQSLAGVKPARHLHIGDNAWSDVEVANKHVARALLYQPEQEHAKRTLYERNFHNREDALRGALESLVNSSQPAEFGSDDFYSFGRKCSILFIGFALMTMERALSNKIDTLYFFTREGEFFREIYNRLRDADVLGLPAPRSHLLMVSRISTFAASLRKFAVNDLMRLWNQYSQQSMQALLKSLAMEPKGWELRLAEHGLDLASPIQYPWMDERVQSFLNDPTTQEKMQKHLHAKSLELEKYLQAEGINKTESKIGIVDIGWRGTIQDNLACTLPNTELVGFYMGLNRFINDQPKNVLKESYGPNLNSSNDLATLLDSVAPLEMLCNSPNGSVTHYEVFSAGARAVRKIDQDENRVFTEYVCRFQAGVLDSVPYWAEFLRTNAYGSEEIRPLAMEVWDSIIHRPHPIETEAYLHLNHNETFGVGGFVEKKQAISTYVAALAFFSREHRLKVQDFLSDFGWTVGLIRCPSVPWPLRLILRILLFRNGVKSKFKVFLRRGRHG